MFIQNTISNFIVDEDTFFIYEEDGYGRLKLVYRNVKKNELNSILDKLKKTDQYAINFIYSHVEITDVVNPEINEKPVI